jgi:hypothetical protein
LATQSTTDFCKTAWGADTEGAASNDSDSTPSQHPIHKRKPLPERTGESRHSICMEGFISVEVLTEFMISNE